MRAGLAAATQSFPDSPDPSRGAEIKFGQQLQVANGETQSQGNIAAFT